MQLSDPFPVECLSRLVKETVLTEFQGRHPTVLEVASIPDAHWLKLPAMGPTRLAHLRSLMQGIRDQLQPPALTQMTVEDLLAKHHQFLAEQDLLKGQLRELRDKFRANRAELWMRGIVPRAE
jgi:hypothetical protein